MWLLLLYLALGYVAHHCALFTVASLAAYNEDFEEFVSRVLMTVYNGIAVVLVTWFFFDAASTAVVAFFAALFFTICRIDLEATHAIMHEDDDE
jgi:hypothetical protein